MAFINNLFPAHPRPREPFLCLLRTLLPDDLSVALSSSALLLPVRPSSDLSRQPSSQLPENSKAAATARALSLSRPASFLAPCSIATPCVAVLTDDAADLNTMSQTTFVDHSIEDLARLEREAESKEYELRQIRAQVAAARQRSIATASHNPDLLSASQSNLQFSSLPASTPQDARLHATPRHGDLKVHTGPQPSVRRSHRPAKFGQSLT